MTRDTEPTAESIRVATNVLMPFCHETRWGTAALDPEPPMRLAYEVVKALMEHQRLPVPRQVDDE